MCSLKIYSRPGRKPLKDFLPKPTKLGSIFVIARFFQLFAGAPCPLTGDQTISLAHLTGALGGLSALQISVLSDYLWRYEPSNMAAHNVVEK